jgi:hypothetical protein
MPSASGLRDTMDQDLGRGTRNRRAPSVDRHKVGRRALIPALNRSSRGILSRLTLGCDRGGMIPSAPTYVWRNLPLDVGHVLAYFVAHEGHHRGQIVMLARQVGHRLPGDVTAGLWQWSKRATESRS